MISKLHYFFLIPLSPWPLISMFNSFNLMVSLLLMLKFGLMSCFLMNLVNLSLSTFMWWLFYSSEFNLEGLNSMNLEGGVKLSMILFICSEIFFFFSFFWSYFHFFLSPSMEIGICWPPSYVESFDCLNVPLINTLILMASGISITVSHHFLIEGKKSKSLKFLITTIILGVFFSILQWMEYKNSFFSLSDSTFGTSFFMLTGFHGIHVLIGTTFLYTTFYRFFKLISSKGESLSFEMASWYWHFVDVVWIFLYFFLYYLNN